MAKRKKKKSTRQLFSFARNGKKKNTSPASPLLLTALKIIGTVGFFAAVAIAFIYMERYVLHNRKSQEPLQIELINQPEWVTDPLQDRMIEVAQFQRLFSSSDAATRIQKNIREYFPWIDQCRVQKAADAFRIAALWRKPLGMISFGSRKFYLDRERMILDFEPLPTLPVVRIEGHRLSMSQLKPGHYLREDDIQAALAILDRLDRFAPQNKDQSPILFEIERIDISNINGREDPRQPHIILYAQDNTEIIWGARLGSWQRHLEATDEEKLAKLFSFYQQYGTLLGNVKYINLRDPKTNVPQPIDQY